MRFTAVFVDRCAPKAIRESKRDRRDRLGLAKPMWCPKCRQFTMQTQESAKVRQCIICEHIFTKTESRKAYRKAS